MSDFDDLMGYREGKQEEALRRARSLPGVTVDMMDARVDRWLEERKK